MATDKDIAIPHLKGKTIEQFLTELEKDVMLDDHGGAIIGERKKRLIKKEEDCE